MAEPIADFCCGCASFTGANASNAQTDYTVTAGVIGPQLQANGWTRLMLRYPGGIHTLGFFPDPNDFYEGPVTDAAVALGQDTRFFWPNMWQLAKMAKCQFAVDSEIEAFHDSLVGTYGITEIIYYLGGPDVLDDPLIEGLRCLKPFINFTPASSVSFCWDALVHDELPVSAEKLARCRRLCDVMRHRGHKVYAEPRPITGVPYWTGYLDGSFCRQVFDENNPTAFAASAPIGERMRLPTLLEDDVTAQSWDATVTPVIRSFDTMDSALFRK